MARMIYTAPGFAEGDDNRTSRCACQHTKDAHEAHRTTGARLGCLVPDCPCDKYAATLRAYVPGAKRRTDR